MSSKSSSSSRHSSPRAMPVETIITRFKSAQQKRQLREMDRSMTKVTELLKNPLKPKTKKKEPLKRSQRSNSVISMKEDVEEVKRSKRGRPRNSEKADSDEEYCPLKLKRHVVLNKVRLKPKHDLKIIAQTNKRKRSVPKKGTTSDVHSEMPVLTEVPSRDVSPKTKRTKTLPQEMTMDEMIQLIEESGSLNDEDLLEILTCPSPVWWEDPPDGYIEDALFTRPRSTAEMYPSIRSQLEENLQERQRSSTPNILSRRERIKGKRVSDDIDAKKNEQDESGGNNNDIDLKITLNKCDEKFIKKRSKLESVLGNLRNKSCKNNDAVSNVTKPIRKTDLSDGSDKVSNKVSVIKNVCSDQVTKAVGNIENDLNNFELSAVKDKQASVSLETDPESTDDDPLTDISFQDDAYLNDLENMNIPMQEKTAASPKKQPAEENKSETLNSFPNLNKVEIAKVVIPVSKEKTDTYYVKEDGCAIRDCSLNKCRTINYNNSSIDPTYSDKESSIIEDYLEMNLFEEEDAIVNKKQKKYSIPEFNKHPVTPVKSSNECKQIDKNMTTSVIKFKNSDNTSINVFKIESVVPKNLPPLKNSDKRKGNTGCVPKNMPPLRRNPGVIRLNSESPKSNKNTTSFDTSECYSNILMQDNIDSISDTNICFLNEDDDDYCIEKNFDNGDIEDIIMGTVIKSSNVIQTNKCSSHNSNRTRNNEFISKESICGNNNVFPTNNLHFSQDADLIKNFTHINGVMGNELNELEFQSLTITKVNDNNCCKAEGNNLDSVVKKRNDMNKLNCEKEQCTKTDYFTTNGSKTCTQNEFTSPTHQEIRKIEKEDAECITVYKIISDDSGNEEPKNEILSNKRTPKSKTKDSKHNIDLTESYIERQSDDSTEKSDSSKDKMIFYFKKCKNLYWKHKNDNKKQANKKDESLVNKTENTGVVDAKTKNNIGNVIKSKEQNKGTTTENNKKEKHNIVNHNNNLTKPNAKQKKCIIVSNTKQIRYCMKCSSIFDTAQCNYCYGKNGRHNKKQCATDYLLRMEQCFVCDVCRYKALSKDSLERHILSQCCNSKHR